ncbi:APC family permease [Pseudonocardia sp. MCCB 268]|nr:APC family permease [Pseudonocardia cytotoxica]
MGPVRLTLLAGGLFLAAWSAYAFETSICYTAEFRDPGWDTVCAIMAAGLACLVIYFLSRSRSCGRAWPERLGRSRASSTATRRPGDDRDVGGGPVIAEPAGS